MHVFLRVFIHTALVICCAQTVYAEGSKELSANGGSRAFWRSSTVVTDQFPFPYPGIIKVYANAGERIYMGSSAQGIGMGTITWRAPDGSTGTSGNSTAIGRIQDRAEETLGPRLTTNGADPGYNPYIVIVGAGQAGVWELTFTPTNPAVAGGTAPIVPANGPWTQNPNSWYIAAFDVSVRNSGNTAFVNGRAFMNMFAGITASVGATFGSFNGIFNILTRDGYQYTFNANGMQGVAFDFFANNKGFRNAAGDASYLSIAGIGTTAGTIPVHNPTMPDDATNVTYKLFFSTPSTDLPTLAPTVDGQTTWLLTTIIVPALSNFTFTGTEGTPNQSGTAPLGGNFTFTSTAAGSYRIGLDVNQNGIFTDMADRQLTGFAVIGNNTVSWDALDGEGNPVPGGTIFLPGSIRIELFSGEVHFPLLDVERNPTGIIVTRINGLNAPDNVLFWDDTNIPDIGTPSAPKRNLGGISSAINGHIWNLNFGNDNGMDSWSYISSAPLLNAVNLVVGQADLEVVRITPSASAFCDGATISYEVEVRNNGPSAVSNTPFNFRSPVTLTGVNATNVVTTGTVTLSSESNTPGVYHADLTMSNGGTIVFTITGTVAGSSITTSADIMRTADVTDPDATNPDIPVPADALAECNAGPSGAGCNNIASSTITVSSPVTGNTISAAQQVCPGDIPVALTGSVPTGGTGVFTYLWESSTTSSSAGFAAAAGVNNGQGYAPAALSSTTWFRRVVNSGCSATSAAVEITVTLPPAAPVVANSTYCQGDMATALTATGTNIKWYNTVTGGTALPSPVIPLTTTAGVTTFWASQTSAGGCESPRASLTVTVFAKPTLQVTSSTADMLTTDPRRELTGNVTGGTFTGTGVVAETGRFYFTPATAGVGTHTITYTYTSGGSCTVSTTFTIRVTAPVADVVVTVVADNNPTGVGDPFDYTITAGNNGPGTATNVVVTDVLPATVEVVSTNASAGTVTGTSTVTWNIPTLPPNTTNTLTITVKPTQLGVIQNTVTIASSQTDNIPANNTSVAAKEIVGLKIPNVITPNGDGYNDRFVIKGLELYPQNQLTIINRWGNHVYEKRNYSNDWTGIGLAEGTYFYILRLTDREGKRHDLKGYLMINR